jgi:threonine/homoserine/homoserine lactone efflux protein
MFGTHDPELFAASLLIFNLTPGPDLLFTLTRTLQHGRRAGVAAAFGIGSGCLVHTAAAAFGLAALLAASAEAFTVVRWIGAAYLLWLAVGLLRAPAAAAPEADRLAEPAVPASAWRVFRQGFLTNALNPKVAIFFLAFLPQFIDADAPHKTLAFLFLGAWFTIQGIVVLTLFVAAVAPLRSWQPSRRWRGSLRAGGAALFAGLAARLALAGRN